jgi:hypothetical protein
MGPAMLFELAVKANISAPADKSARLHCHKSD